MERPLTTGNFGRPRVGLPNARIVNAYIEQTKGGPAELVRTARPGLLQTASIGTGPILRQYQQPGLFQGATFSVSGAACFMGTTSLGSVAYSNAPRFAAANGYLALVSGGALYIYDGTRFYPQTTFDDNVSLLPPFSGVVVLDNIFCYAVAGSNQFFFSSPGDPSTINAANFSAAQTSSGPIVEGAVLADELYWFGATVVEIWDFTGALTAPFAVSQGRTYSKGCAAQNSVCALDNSLFWLGNDLTIYRTSNVPIRVSTSFIEDRLKKEADAGKVASVYAFTFSVEGHVFYVINLPTLGESYAYDCQTSEWGRWGTQTGRQFDPGLWIPRTAAGWGDTIVLGSNSGGELYALDLDNFTDNGTPIQCIVAGAHWMTGGIMRCNNVSIQMVRGVANANVPNPIAQMRYSDDGGRTFSSWRTESMGQVGGYTFKATWRALGAMTQPGRLFEFAVMDAVNFTVESASMNEARV